MTHDFHFQKVTAGLNEHCIFSQCLFCATLVYIRFPPQPTMPRFLFTFSPLLYSTINSLSPFASFMLYFVLLKF